MSAYASAKHMPSILPPDLPARGSPSAARAAAGLGDLRADGAEHAADEDFAPSEQFIASRVLAVV
jgi:hypothetical protein